MDYLFPALGFITGGGLTALFSVRYVRKNTKLDYADRAIKFMEEQETRMIYRFKNVEKRVQQLEDISCMVIECKDRKKAI